MSGETSWDLLPGMKLRSPVAATVHAALVVGPLSARAAPPRSARGESALAAVVASAVTPPEAPCVTELVVDRAAPPRSARGAPTELWVAHRDAQTGDVYYESELTGGTTSVCICLEQLR